MRNVRDWEESDLDALVAAGQKENTNIDYKDSASLKFKDRAAAQGHGSLGEKHKKDLAADVASMANAEGGLIVYGIVERTAGYPDHIDAGVTHADVVPDTIERVILSNINPRVEGFFIRPIELKSKGAGAFAYVVQVPKAERYGPHQTTHDHLYHRRHDATKLPMSDGEVRSAMARSLQFGRRFGAAWDLLVEMRRIIAAAADRAKLGNDHMPRTRLTVTVSNNVRASGEAIMLLPKPVRAMCVQIINAVDQYNSTIETVDPGQRDEARLTTPLRTKLSEMEALGNEICGALLKVLDEEPA